MSIDFEELSDMNIIRSNIGNFKRMMRQGVSSSTVSQSYLSKWRKLGIVFYNHRKKQYDLTQYGDQLLKRVLNSV
jgi:predicted transcriptional regulator